MDFELKKSYYSRFFRYYNALMEGKRSAVEHSDDDPSAGCRQLYGTCPNNIKDTINLDVLRIMQVGIYFETEVTLLSYYAPISL